MSTLHVAKLGNTSASTGHDRAGRCSYAMGGVHLSPGHALFAVAEIGKRSAGLPLRCKKKIGSLGCRALSSCRPALLFRLL